MVHSTLEDLLQAWTPTQKRSPAGTLGVAPEQHCAHLGMLQGLGGLLRVPVSSASHSVWGVQGQPRGMGRGSLFWRSSG